MNDEQQSATEQTQDSAEESNRPADESAAEEAGTGGESGEGSRRPASNLWIGMLFLAVLIGMAVLGLTTQRAPAIRDMVSSPNPTQAGQPVFFSAAVEMGRLENASYEWDFGDDQSASGEQASHTYSEPGDYTAELTVTSGTGSENSETILITVQEELARVSPTITSFTANPRSGSLPLEVTFQVSAQGNSAEIEEYRWDLTNDGSPNETTSEPTLTHTFQPPEEDGQDQQFFPVSVNVVDAEGNVSTAAIGISGN